MGLSDKVHTGLDLDLCEGPRLFKDTWTGGLEATAAYYHYTVGL